MCTRRTVRSDCRMWAAPYWDWYRERKTAYLPEEETTREDST